MSQLLSVEDHGIWRGRRTWTVRLRDDNGTSQVSVVDETTEEAAIAQARAQFDNRRIWTDADRAAMAKTNAALGRALS